MKITPLIPAQVPSVKMGGAPKATGAADGNLNFTKGLNDALGELSKTQNEADEMVTKMVTGEVTDLHQVVIAVERANAAMQMAVQVRNKVVETYQEIMHIQV